MKASLAAATVSAACVFCASGAHAGITFTQVTRDDGGRNGTETRVSLGEGSVKIEYLQTAASNPFFSAGSYLLIKGGEMLLVNPADRAYSRFDMRAMQDAMSAAGQMGGMSGSRDAPMSIEDVRVEKLLDEAGETMQGYPTRHYRYKTSYTMQMTGAPVSMAYEIVEDVWASNALDVGEVFGTGDFDAARLPGAVRELAEAQQVKQTTGLPLKHVIVQRIETNAGGGPLARMAAGMMGGMMGGETTTTIETKDIRELDIPASEFEIPSDYAERDLMQGGRAMPGPNSLGN